MEFEEMKKIWDTQNSAPLYAINEEALHNSILSKKKTSHHITNISELLGISVYVLTGCFILGLNLYKQTGNIYMYLLAAWMLGSGVFLLVNRISRINGNDRFDRSMRGDLQHAISMATYQVRLSLLMRWNILPIGMLAILVVWEGRKSIWIAAGMFLFFLLTNYAGGWEHRIYKSRKRELELLQTKLSEEQGGQLS